MFEGARSFLCAIVSEWGKRETRVLVLDSEREKADAREREETKERKKEGKKERKCDSFLPFFVARKEERELGGVLLEV